MIKEEKIMEILRECPAMPELAMPTGLQVVVGNDLVHTPTFRLSCTPLFIRRSYTPHEIAYCEQFDDPMLRYASTWAAKEAVYKIIKQVDATVRLWWPDIEIHRDKPQGKPQVAVKKLPMLEGISLTISHDGDYVWALAAWAHAPSAV